MPLPHRKNAPRRSRAAANTAARNSAAITRAAYHIEPLEGRRYLTTQPVGTALLDSADQTAGQLTIVINYSNNITINTLGDDDLSVVGRAASSHKLSVHFQGQTTNSQTTITTATYFADDNGAPFFSATDTTTYDISINSNAVKYSNGSKSISPDNIGSAFVDGNGPIVTTTNVSVDNSNQAVGAAVTIDVSYSDNTGLNENFQPDDLQITGPGSTHFTPTSVSTLVSGINSTVAYTVTIPNSTSNSGTYTASTTGIVTDIFGNPITAGTRVGQFFLDFDPPNASLQGTPTIDTSQHADHDTVTVNVDYQEGILVLASNPSPTEVTLHASDNSIILPSSMSLQPISQFEEVATYQFIIPNKPAKSGSYMILDAGGVKNSDNDVLPPTTLGSINLDFTPPSAAPISNITITQPVGFVEFTVTYTDLDKLQEGNFLNFNGISVTGPNGFSATAFGTPVIGEGGAATVSYQLNAPSGGFTAANNGTYTLSTVAGSVIDDSGNAILAAGIGNLTINIDNIPPTAALVAPPTFTAGATSVNLSVNYSDNVGINASTIANEQLVFSSLSVSASATLIGTSGSGTLVTANYSVPIPGGLSNANNGTVGIFLQSIIGHLTDTSGNALAPVVLGNFSINLPVTIPPTAALAFTPSPAKGDTAINLLVSYSSTSPINPATVNINNLTLQGPGFSITPNLIQAFPVQGNTETAQYIFQLPHALTTADNGTYTLSTTSTGVADTAGNTVLPGSFAALTIAIVAPSAPADTTPPTATLTTAPAAHIDTASAQIVVTYTDNVAVNSSTISNTNILITGPGSFSQLATLISQSTSGPTITATYSFPAPGGFFDPADNGAYTLALQPNSISDTNNNFTPATSLGAITLKIAPPAPGPDFTATWKTAPASTNPTTKTTPISFILKNAGTKPSKGNIQAKIFAFTGAIFDPTTAKTLATLTIPATLAKGKSSIIKTTIPTPTKLPAGPYHLALILKAPPAMHEQFHSNNTAVAKTITTIKQPAKKAKPATAGKTMNTVAFSNSPITIA